MLISTQPLEFYNVGHSVIHNCGMNTRMNALFSIIQITLCWKKSFASQPLLSELTDPLSTKISVVEINRGDWLRAFSEAKVPGGLRLDCLSIRFLSPVELTLLFGLEAFELERALARFPGFLVWTGKEWETPFLRYFRTLSSCAVPTGGS